MAKVGAAILTSEISVATDLLKRLKKADFIQFDVMDNTFVPGKTLGAKSIRQLNPKRRFEFHLMIKSPEKHLSEFIKCKPYRIIVHIEATKKLDYIIRSLKTKKIKVGIAINPETKLSKLAPYLNRIDYVLFMTVHPGKQKQKFLKSVLSKVKKLRNLSKIDIGVDGGVNKETARLAIKAGVTTLNSGSFLAKNPKEIAYFKKL